MQTTAIARYPKWTEFHEVTETEVPESDWNSWWGIRTADAVVTKRFAYPVAKPPLYVGDRILRVDSRLTKTDDDLQQQLNLARRDYVRLHVERQSNTDKPLLLRIMLYRADPAEMRKQLLSKARRIPAFDMPLLHTTTHGTFGLALGTPVTLAAVADFEGQPTHIYETAPMVPQETPMAKQVHLTMQQLSPFIVRDINLSWTVPANRIQPGDAGFVPPTGIAIEDQIHIQLSGRRTKVNVLSTFPKPGPHPSGSLTTR